MATIVFEHNFFSFVLNLKFTGICLSWVMVRGKNYPRSWKGSEKPSP